MVLNNIEAVRLAVRLPLKSQQKKMFSTAELWRCVARSRAELPSSASSSDA